MRSLALLLLLPIGGVSASLVPPALELPRLPYTALLVDGRTEAREWANAGRIEIGEGAWLLGGQVGDSVRLAVTGPDPLPRVVDVFVRTESGRLLQFHASMALGERDLTLFGEPVDAVPWTWHVHPGWQATRANIDASKPRDLAFGERLMPRDGVEFEWLRERFEGHVVLLRIHVSSFAGSEPELVYPPESSFENSDGWLRLDLSGSD